MKNKVKYKRFFVIIPNKNKNMKIFDKMKMLATYKAKYIIAHKN
jgi:hypothetical protein